MVPDASLLAALVLLVDRIPLPAPPPARRGRPRVYSDRLFLKALVVMIVKRRPRGHLLLAVLEEPTPEMRRLRALLGEGGRYPCRRTWERRLAAIPESLPGRIGCLGRCLVEVLAPWAERGWAAAIDSTLLPARGGVWHRKDRVAGIVPHTSIDTEAHWGKSGWHGWVYGWKLHVVTSVAAAWIPLAAELTPANAADNEQAPRLLPELPGALRFLLGDTGSDDGELRERCAARDCELVTSRRGAYPHRDGGVEVRRVFHQLRSHAIENFNAQFKGIFECHGQVPTRGLRNTRRYILGAVFVYQLTLLHRFEAGEDLRVGLKPLLRAA